MMNSASSSSRIRLRPASLRGGVGEALEPMLATVLLDAEGDTRLDESFAFPDTVLSN